MGSGYGYELNRLLALNTNPKFDLGRIEHLLKLLKLRSEAMRVVQVVGTNGKGSSVAFMESILKARGIKCGLFSSPHLSCARERIRINGEMISEDQFVESARHVLSLASKFADKPSFFEAMLAMAMWTFNKLELPVVILEAGLGGRLDATTAVGAEVLGVSMIDFDHQAILGNSIAAIAKEKIAAARPWQKVVSVEQTSAARLVIEEAQKCQGFELWWSKPCIKPLGLFGEHQAYNAGLAISCLERLDVGVDAYSIETGLLEVKWPGRFEVVSKDPYIVLDGAHNPSGICALIKAVKAEQKFAKQPLFLIFGSLKSVNTPAKIALLLELAPQRVYVHCSKNPRAEEAKELIDLFLAAGLKVPIAPLLSWNEAVRDALAQGANILTGGSLYTVGEARSFFLDVPTDPAQPNY